MTSWSASATHSGRASRCRRCRASIAAPGAAGETGAAAIVDRFCERVAEYQATVTRVTAAELADAVAALCRARDAQRIACRRAARTCCAGVEVVVDEPPLSPQALDRARRRADRLRAGDRRDRTRSCSTAAQRSGRRALTLVPDWHICIVEASAVVAGVPDAVAMLASVAAEGRPITLVSGPSATADIELGPRRGRARPAHAGRDSRLGMTQFEKAEAFRALHEGEPFVFPNPWDAGSARMLEALGFKALATTSSGFAFTRGRLDGGVTLDEVAEHTRAAARSRRVPVAVDLENGYGDAPEAAALAITTVAAAGAVGGSIEDYDGAGTLYPLDLAVERVAAAVEAARALDFPFTLTARAEGQLHEPGPRRHDRAAAGLRASGRRCPVRSRAAHGDEVRAVCSAVSRPVNVLGHKGLSMAEIADAGGQRVSIGGALDLGRGGGRRRRRRSPARRRLLGAERAAADRRLARLARAVSGER